MTPEEEFREWIRDPEDDEPPFNENHYYYHTPAGPNPSCPNCAYLNWRQP